MLSKSKPENFKLHVTLMVTVVGGLVWAELGQRAGTHWGAPYLGVRFIFALVPYALLAIGQMLLARSRADLVILLVCAVLVAITNDGLFGKPDELGLIYVVVPIVAAMLAGAALVVVLIRVWVAKWLKRRKDTAQAPPNPSLGPRG